MRRKTLRLGIALFIIALRYLSPSIPLDTIPANQVSGKIIIIDPGHGGIDPGCSSKNGAKEKDIVLEISKKLAKKLNSLAIYTVLTRESDTDLAKDIKGPLIRRKREDLNRRAQLAKTHKADLLISIHANSFPESRWSGAQTFYSPECGRSRLLAEAIQNSLVISLGPNNRKAKPGDFRILRESTVPSAMVEVGFLSNPKEAALLQNENYQEKVAQAIAKGIVDYFKSKGAASVSAKPLQPEVFVRPSLQEKEVLLFYASLENNGLLDYEKRTITSPKPSDVLKELQAKPQNQNSLRELLEGPASLSFLGITKTRAYVSVDLSALNLTGHLEELAVYSIVNTLTMLPGIEEVAVEVLGGSEEFDWSKPLKFNSYLIKDSRN